MGKFLFRVAVIDRRGKATNLLTAEEIIEAKKAGDDMVVSTFCQKEEVEEATKCMREETGLTANVTALTSRGNYFIAHSTRVAPAFSGADVKAALELAS